MVFTKQLRITNWANEKKYKYLSIITACACLVYYSCVVTITPRMKKNFENSNLSFENFFIFENNTPVNVHYVNITLPTTKSSKTPSTTKPVKRPVTFRPHKDRFKFIHEKKTLSLDGPIMNTIPFMVTWLQDLSHIEICNMTHPSILAVVTSALTHWKERDLIRNTWASSKLYRYTGTRTVFVLGATEDQELQEQVNREIRQHNDIIQYNFIDSYRNLTYKTTSWLTWVNRRCPDVPFVAKIDDDVIVNPFHLNKFLMNELRKPTVQPLNDQERQSRQELHDPATNYIYGRLETHPHPHRSGKWGVTKDEYPEDIFPAFLLGPSYILGGNVVGRLVKYAPYTPFLWLEDVYITGLVAHAAQIHHIQTMTIFSPSSSRDLAAGNKCFWTEPGNRDKIAIWKEILFYSGIKL